MNIADDLVRAFNDGYEKGKADAEAYMLHCGDTDEPQTNADRIRAMSDEELAEFFAQQKYRKPVFDGWLPLCNYVMGPRMCHEDGCEKCWLDWLGQEALR